ncbi:MAG: DHA2 family efflux MFS transporter permease subunit [Thermoleophilaceae bacterium]
MDRKQLTLIASILGSGIVFLDGSVVNVALPALREDLHAGLATQQWVVEGYLLTLSALLLVGGSLGDLLGRRRVFLFGLGGFGATSALCAVAPNAELLVAGRILQGVAGALLVPSSLAIITSCFEGEERGAAVGTWTAWTGIFFILGPLVGGFLIDAVSWRLIFAINLPLVAAAMMITARAVAESASTEGHAPIDFVGAGLCVAGLAGPVFALTEEPTRGFGDPVVLIRLVLGLAAFAAFIAYERRTSHPMVPLKLFKSRNFAVANLACLTLYAGLSGMTFFLGLYLQQVAGYSALQAGLAFTPVTVISFLLARRFGLLAMRHGPRLYMGAGPLVAGVGLLLLLRVGKDVNYATDLLPPLVLFGIGLSMTVAPLTSTVLSSVDERHAGAASGANNAVSRVAGLIGIAIVGAVVAAQFSSSLDTHLADGGRTGPAVQSAADSAKSRPLVGTHSDRAYGVTLGPAVDEASTSAFHAGMLLSALLVLLGGVISGVGITDQRVSVTEPPVPSTEHRVHA